MSDIRGTCYRCSCNRRGSCNRSVTASDLGKRCRCYRLQIDSLSIAGSSRSEGKRVVREKREIEWDRTVTCNSCNHGSPGVADGAADPPRTTPCASCTRPMVASMTWRRASSQARDEWRAAGYRRQASPVECAACYQRRHYTPRGTTTPMSGEVVYDEYLMFKRAGLSQRQNCALVAEELGMSAAAVERAVLRAKRRLQNASQEVS